MMRFPQWSLGLALIVACGGGGPTDTDIDTTKLKPPLAQSVRTQHLGGETFVFQPASTRIAAGGNVTWTNSASAGSNVLHSITSDTDAWTADTIAAGESFRVDISTAGRFPYRCVFHAGMVGTVVVE